MYIQTMGVYRTGTIVLVLLMLFRLRHFSGSGKWGEAQVLFRAFSSLILLTPILKCLGDVVTAHFLLAFNIGDGASDF